MLRFVVATSWSTLVHKFNTPPIVVLISISLDANSARLYHVGTEIVSMVQKVEAGYLDATKRDSRLAQEYMVPMHQQSQFGLFACC